MRSYGMLLAVMSLAIASTAVAQSEGDRQPGWRAAEGNAAAATAATTARDESRRDGDSSSSIRLAQHVTSVASSPGTPGTRQVYSIQPYTRGVTSTRRPQQAVIDWILRETGYEAWHGDVEASLSATESEVRVVHTDEMKKTVKGIVDRFTNQDALTRSFGVHVITLDEPDWRARAFRTLKGIPTQSPGVAAWLLEREHAVTLLAELAKRSDYREPPENNVQPMLENGQSFVLSSTRAISYLRDIANAKPPVAGPQPVSDQLTEGMSLEFSPLLSVDNRMIDAVLKCHIDQVEALRPVMVDVPIGLGVNQGVRLDVPQTSQFRLHERFRWPVDQVLLVSLGIVPSPYRPSQPMMANLKSLGSLNFGETVPARCEVLVFVECKGKNTGGVVQTGQNGLKRSVRTSYHHRY